MCPLQLRRTRTILDAGHSEVQTLIGRIPDIHSKEILLSPGSRFKVGALDHKNRFHDFEPTTLNDIYHRFLRLRRPAVIQRFRTLSIG
jgi:hypothetical protein